MTHDEIRPKNGSYTFPELHADLFSHASPLEVYVFVAVANRGEDVMSDEIFSSIQ